MKENKIKQDRLVINILSGISNANKNLKINQEVYNDIINLANKVIKFNSNFDRVGLEELLKLVALMRHEYLYSSLFFEVKECIKCGQYMNYYVLGNKCRFCSLEEILK